MYNIGAFKVCSLIGYSIEIHTSSRRSAPTQESAPPYFPLKEILPVAQAVFFRISGLSDRAKAA